MMEFQLCKKKILHDGSKNVRKEVVIRTSKTMRNFDCAPTVFNINGEPFFIVFNHFNILVG